METDCERNEIFRHTMTYCQNIQRLNENLMKQLFHSFLLGTRLFGYSPPHTQPAIME